MTLRFERWAFVVGVSMVGAVWWYARTFRVRLPLVSLLLIGLTRSIIVWGDSVRAYGAGIVLMIVTGALLWRYVERPTGARLAFAAAAALASVHTLFYNSVFLLAFSLGAIAVCWTRRDFRAALGVVGIGLLAAISVLAYVPTIQARATWSDLLRVPNYSIGYFWEMLGSTVGHRRLYIWVGLSIAALVAALRSIKNEIVLFSTVTLVASVAGIFLFLRALSYPTQDWYYISLLAISAVCMDAIFGTTVRGDVARKLRLAGISLVAARMMFPLSEAVTARMTRIDRIADRLDKEANAGDFVLVNPWFAGLSFTRYYRGSAPWQTVPPIEFHLYHRYDLMKQKMLVPDQHLVIAPLENQMRAALSAGHRVFVVGYLPDSTRLAVLETAPVTLQPLNGVIVADFEDRWALMIARFLSVHATSVEQVIRNRPGSTNPLEPTNLVVATGWRP
jgi:hypothetical protein